MLIDVPIREKKRRMDDVLSANPTKHSMHGDEIARLGRTDHRCKAFPRQSTCDNASSTVDEKKLYG